MVATRGERLLLGRFECNARRRTHCRSITRWRCLCRGERALDILAGKPAPPKEGGKAVPQVKLTLFDVPDKMLRVPEVDGADFEAVLARAPASVSPDELTQFEKWTAEFGQEG